MSNRNEMKIYPKCLPSGLSVENSRCRNLRKCDYSYVDEFTVYGGNVHSVKLPQNIREIRIDGICHVIDSDSFTIAFKHKPECSVRIHIVFDGGIKEDGQYKVCSYNLDFEKVQDLILGQNSVDLTPLEKKIDDMYDLFNKHFTALHDKLNLLAEADITKEEDYGLGY